MQTPSPSNRKDDNQNKSDFKWATHSRATETDSSVHLLLTRAPFSDLVQVPKFVSRQLAECGALILKSSLIMRDNVINYLYPIRQTEYAADFR